MKNRQNFGKRFLDWRKDGETIGWVHPKLGIHYRYSHGMIPIPNSNGQEKFKFSPTIVCLGKEKEDVPRIDCPFCSLGIWAKDATTRHQAESVILESGEGENFRSYNLGDLAGGKNVPYQKKIYAKFEGLIPWIKNGTEVTDIKEAVEVFKAPSSLVEKLIDTIDEQISMRGSPQGEPVVPEGFQLRMKKGKLLLVSESTELEWNPYPFKLRYLKKEIPQNQYKVTKLDLDIFPLTPEIMQIMMTEEEELNLDFSGKEQSLDAQTQLSIIKSVWTSRTIPFEMFLDFFQKRSGKAIEPKDVPIQSEEKEEPAPKAAPETGKKFKCGSCGETVAPMKPSNRCPECGTKMNLDEDVPF